MSFDNLSFINRAISEYNFYKQAMQLALICLFSSNVGDNKHTGESNEHTSESNEHTSGNNKHTGEGNEHTNRNNKYTSESNKHTSEGNEHTSKNNEYTSESNEYTTGNNKHTNGEQILKIDRQPLKICPKQSLNQGRLIFSQQKKNNAKIQRRLYLSRSE